MSENKDSDYLTIARIRKVWGNRGEVAAEILTDFPERFHPGAELLLLERGSRQKLSLESAWFHKGLANLKFQGFNDISAAETLVGREIQIALSDRKPLRRGEIYLSDLVGCEVWEDGKVLGKVETVEQTGGAPLLQVLTGSGELLIPFAEEICRTVDIERRQIHVRLPAGLKELNERSAHAAGHPGNHDD